MKKALIRPSQICRPKICRLKPCRADAGVTMILVAICMVAIVAMAALSIDVVTLYLARMEAQRTADAAALAAARVISLSGITGDPNDTSGYWTRICGGSAGVATQAAQAAATQTVDNAAPTVTVTYSGGGSSDTNCTSLVPGSGAFAVNPMVTVQVTRSNLPTFFSHIWGHTGSTTTATATAEAFNPSNSSSVASGGQIIPVQPRCVKPWMVPNYDPLSPAPVHGDYCSQTGGPGACNPIVNRTTGQIQNPGISLNGSNASGIIGEQFLLAADCKHTGASCALRQPPPQANYILSPYIAVAPNLLYVPGQAPTITVAVPGAGSGDPYEEAIAGCDQSTVYACGVANQNTVDLNENPISSGDTINGVEALIHQSTAGTSIDGQDQINLTTYPFQILAGSSNPLAGSGLSGNAITSSNSIVTIPVYDSANTINGAGNSPVTIVGFLQVFINYVDQYGNVNVTVLNVAGCGNGANSTGSAVTGSSPVPIRLISQ